MIPPGGICERFGMMDKAVFGNDPRQVIDWNANNETEVGPYDRQSIRYRKMATLSFLWEIAVFHSTPTPELYKSHLSNPSKRTICIYKVAVKESVRSLGKY